MPNDTFIKTVSPLLDDGMVIIMSIKKKLFGILPDGHEVYSYTLRSRSGMKVKICEYGGAVMQIKVPDKNGCFEDVVCGYSSLDSYLKADGYQGALIGRVGNRICGGRFQLDGKEYTLFKNDGSNSLHGGKIGFDSRCWRVEAHDGDEPALVLTLTSPDGDEGYPGTLNVTVIYTLTASNGLSIEYRAVTDRATVVNLTNHTYFNLSGYASGNVLDHELFLDADRFLPTDSALIPTGEQRSVANTPFDFRDSKALKQDFKLDECAELSAAGGYDHCLCFTNGETAEPILRGVLTDPASGRKMKLYTNQPCVQLYTGNFLCNESFPFKGGCPQRRQMALCLETQKMPDSINQNGFTSTVLRPGETYRHKTIYEFSALCQ